ncbi:MAG: AraC family transcriptional regulator [Clostridia bacterium]|nr:AraC family transcriptional regulator [Clostridia bacterium]
MSSYLDQFVGVGAPVKIHAWEIYHHVTTGPHTLPCYLLTYVYRNHSLHIWDDNIQIIKKGDLLLIHPGQMHRFVMPQDLYMYHCLFEEYEVPQIDLQSLSNRIAHIPLVRQKDVEEFFLKIDTHHKTSAHRYPPERMRDYLSELLSIYSNESNYSDHMEVDFGYNYIVDTMQMLKEDRNLSIPALADIIGLHPDYLNRLFKRHLQISIMDYKILLRIMDGVDALKNTDKTVKDIALSLGYTKVSNFISHFKKFCMMTPTEYRAYIRKKFYV